jgi:hypothetical protein
VNAKLNTPKAYMNMELGLQGSSQGLLQFFSPEVCDTPYGCFGTSPFPPDLTIQFRYSPLTITAALSCSSLALSAFHVERFLPPIAAKLGVQKSSIGTAVEMFGSSALATSLPKANIRSLTVRLGANQITPSLSTLVCAPDFQLSGPSMRNLVFLPPFPGSDSPQVELNASDKYQPPTTSLE